MTITTRARFSPRVMPHDLLERLFVGRENHLGDIADAIDAAVASDERSHRLYVGPRGAGKTHLLSLAYHRCVARPAATAPGIAWLDEDPWAISSYTRLLAAIGSELQLDIDPLGDPTLAENQIRSATSAAPAILFAENLDQILTAIGRTGQQRLRSLLQNHGSLLLIATTTQLSRDLLDEARPFYGFFTTTKLQPFGTDEAIGMLEAIAMADNNLELAKGLRTPEARARVQAAEVLAGGQPRIWALLAGAITLARLDELVDTLFTQLDDLTPYYQHQLDKLSPTQRQLISELIHIDHAINVKDLATAAGVDERQAAKALKELANKGWVAEPATTLTHLLDRRQRFYELQEPLLRLAFELKASRGEPIDLVVDFLTAWFDPDELAIESSDHFEEEADRLLLDGYLEAAGSSSENDEVGAAHRVLTGRTRRRRGSDRYLLAADEALEALQDRSDPSLLLSLPTPIRRLLETRLNESKTSMVRVALHESAVRVRSAQKNAESWLRQAETIGADADHVGLLARWHIENGDATTGFKLVEEERYRSLIRNFVWRSIQTKQFEAAVGGATRIVTDKERLHGRDATTTLAARVLLAQALMAGGRSIEAVEEFELLIADNTRVHGPNSSFTLGTRLRATEALLAAGRCGQAVTELEQLVADNERLKGRDSLYALMTRMRLAQALLADERADEAVTAHQSLVEDNERPI